MYQIALQQPTQNKMVPVPDQRGVLTHITLNYHEVVCIELALVGLTENIRNKNLPEALAGFSLAHLSAQLHYLNYWLNQPTLKSQLRLDGKNSVLWPFTSSELVDWLLRICQSCISEGAILIASAEAASCEYTEFAEMYVDGVDSYSLADYLSYSNFSAFQCYYNDIVATCQDTLVRKLTALCGQDYPLFPQFSLLN